jgi:hypothetical protein
MKKAIAAVFGAAVIGLLLFLYRPAPNLPVQVKYQPTPETVTPAPSIAYTPIPIAHPSPAAVTEADRRLLSTLNQILVSKNDNDPRLDKDFKNLSAGTKQLLMERYQTLPMEARNERGTIVFLIGRELTRPEDFAFLAQVTSEAPCLSLSDCKKEGSRSPEDVHEEAAISVTLAYPQHVAEKSIENLLDQASQVGADPTRVQEALAALDKMAESPVSSISHKASELQARYVNLRK